MSRPAHWTIAVVASFSLFLAACGGGGNGSPGGTGGGGGGSGGGSGGGGTGPGLSISVVSPSAVPVGSNLGGITVYGQGFSFDSQVLIDGQPANPLAGTTSTSIQAQIATSMTATTGTHQVAVETGSTVSNSLPFTVYSHPQGPFVMQATPGFLVGEYLSDPSVIVAADVNGDGLSDVIESGWPTAGTGTIAILYGQADGTLSPAQYLSLPTQVDAVAAGDVDGNGTVDLVAVTVYTGDSTATVNILAGDGHGNFQPPVTQQTFSATYPGPAQLADLDGDGKPDLILALATKIVWLKNIGGGFAAPVTLASSSANTPNFSIADFNGDGMLDILCLESDSKFHMLLNQGSGQFSDQLASGLGISGTATVLDFNLDGIPDVVVTSYNITGGMLYSFAGQGNGSFTQVASMSTPELAHVVVGDFDHDGFPDLAGPSGNEPADISYLWGDGQGNFTVQSFVGPAGGYVAVGDFNGDGIPDVVIPDLFNFVSLSLGRTNRNFPAPVALYPATMTELSTGDINGDGWPDIFVGGDPIPPPITGTVFISQNGGTSFNLAAYTDPSTFEVADMTGKGVVDLLGGDANLEIWPNNGTPNFSSSPITLSQPTATITVADMDGDGFPDIVSATGQIFYGNGNYQFTPVSVPGGIGAPYVIGDFNGDGKPDIATGSGTLLNQGNRSFQLITNNNLPLANGAMTAVGDFNGDGKRDIAINLPGETIISIYYSNGDGTFYQAVQVDPGQYPGAIWAGDFNGDGKTDLAVGLMLSQQACILFNEGNGQFSRSFFASGADVDAMVSADMNRDGKPDLVIGNFVFDFAPANVNVVYHQ